jgi:hypothetical protein
VLGRDLPTGAHAPMLTPPINENPELTRGPLQLTHYPEVSVHSSRPWRSHDMTPRSRVRRGQQHSLTKEHDRYR